MASVSILRSALPHGATPRHAPPPPVRLKPGQPPLVTANSYTLTRRATTLSRFSLSSALLLRMSQARNLSSLPAASPRPAPLIVCAVQALYGYVGEVSVVVVGLIDNSNSKQQTILALAEWQWDQDPAGSVRSGPLETR